MWSYKSGEFASGKLIMGCMVKYKFYLSKKFWVLCQIVCFNGKPSVSTESQELCGRPSGRLSGFG